VWQVAGITPGEQVALLQAQGLPPERALRLVLTVPPLHARGQRERVRLASRLLFEDARWFWQVVESLHVYWGIHPWSLLGEPLPYQFHRQWCRELGGYGTPKGLRFCGHPGGQPTLPANLCASRIELDQLSLRELPKGWIVDELILLNCRHLRGSLADVTVLQDSTISGCPHFSRD
jgi:hypothetical protein